MTLFPGAKRGSEGEVEDRDKNRKREKKKLTEDKGKEDINKARGKRERREGRSERREETLGGGKMGTIVSKKHK